MQRIPANALRAVGLLLGHPVIAPLAVTTGDVATAASPECSEATVSWLAARAAHSLLSSGGRFVGVWLLLTRWAGAASSGGGQNPKDRETTS